MIALGGGPSEVSLVAAASALGLAVRPGPVPEAFGPARAFAAVRVLVAALC